MTRISRVDKLEPPLYLYVYDILCDPSLVSWLLYEDPSLRTAQKLVDQKIWPAYIVGFKRIFRARNSKFGLILTLEHTGLRTDEVWGAVVEVDSQEELERILQIYDVEKLEYYYIEDVYYPDGSVSEGYYIKPIEENPNIELPHCIYMSRLCSAANFWDRRVRGYKWKFFKNLYGRDNIPILATSCRCFITDYTGDEQEIQCNCEPDGLICKI
ncbi:MAG: hypothetical protein GXO23_05205 [Crenarchaeota archaeon]|nr:hypothetical protein [Thermoproteota archaeon]